MAAGRPRPSETAKRPLTLKSLENSALYHLQRRALTTAQLKKLLERKARRSLPCDDAPAWIDDVIARCTRAGYLDDARVAAGRASSLHARGKSARAIAHKLRAQGVDDDTARAALEGKDDLEAARAYVRRRRLHARDPQKAIAALARQGFTLTVAKKALAPTQE